MITYFLLVKLFQLLIRYLSAFKAAESVSRASLVSNQVSTTNCAPLAAGTFLNVRTSFNQTLAFFSKKNTEQKFKLTTGMSTAGVATLNVSFN